MTAKREPHHGLTPFGKAAHKKKTNSTTVAERLRREEEMDRTRNLQSELRSDFWRREEQRAKRRAVERGR